MSFRSILTLLFAVFFFTRFAEAAEPIRDVKYDSKHARNVLDFWPALKQGAPSPVFVFFHGGGFRNGDKSQLERNQKSILDAHRAAGYAVVSCNYPFLARGMDYPDIARHCVRAVQFVRSKSKEWNIDPKRLVCGGVSAGALISEFLGYHDDFADPKAEDTVTRESSRPAVVVGIMQPVGTKEFALRYMDKGEAPIFLYSNADPSDSVHPPTTVTMLEEKAKELGIPCVVCGGGRNSLPKVPDGKSWIELQLEFCEKHLSK
jgi:acetyl esterase/lipase